MPNDFVNDDLIYLISKFNKNVNVDHLTNALKYMSENIDLKDTKVNFLEIIILTTIDYINKKGIVTDYNKQLGNILVHIKGIWSSSSVKDKEIKECKDYLSKIVKQGIGVKTPWYITTIVISIAMYVFARSLYRNQY